MQNSVLRTLLLLFLPALLTFSCKNKKADLVLINGFVHTVNADRAVEQAVAIHEGKIVAVGTSDEIKADYKAGKIIDLKGKSMYPGFIDGHCHYYGFSMGLNQVDLAGTSSFEEVVSLVDSFGKNYTSSEWIIGRGWDQNDWDIREFPDNKVLNKLFPNRPVILKRIDGHAAIANREALKRAGINAGKNIRGGRIGTKKGLLTGLLIDNAVDLVDKVIPPPTDSLVTSSLIEGEKRLFTVGITTVDDAGLDKRIINLIDSLQQAGDLRLRVYAMANPTDENKKRFFESGPYKTDRLNVRSFKIYADGALGSRGACLLSPYNDDSGRRGFILQKPKEYRELIAEIAEHGFQANTHCIGDSANRMILNMYAPHLEAGNDLRWRIEHAQVVHPSDFPKFGNLGVIPSVQPVHATSDMYWVEDRIGKTRLKGAYAYKSLYEQNGTIAFGSDFPVESINPMLGYYAAVVRKDLEGYPFDGFRAEQKVSRDIALYGMTLGAAHANFEEKEKGSIEVGKVADLVVLDRDIIFCKEEDIPKARSLLTIVNGEIVYSSDND